MSNVRPYTDRQLLERIEAIGGRVPNRGKYLIIGVQSQEDSFNLFDDKFYVFDGNEFKDVSTGTTNPGKTALLYYDKYNLPGSAVWKTDEYYKDLYVPGLHKRKMKALRQSKPILYYRDSDKDQKAEEQGTLFNGVIYANMHGVSYNPYSSIIKTRIGGWSFGCQVWNKMSDYRNMIKATWNRGTAVDYCLLKEF